MGAEEAGLDHMHTFKKSSGGRLSRLFSFPGQRKPLDKTGVKRSKKGHSAGKYQGYRVRNKKHALGPKLPPPRNVCLL